MKGIAEDYNIALESINLFRDNLKPCYSRNLWPYLEQLSPLDP